MSAAVSSITRSAGPTARVPELDGLLGITLASLVITLALAWLSWTFFEKPFVNFGHAWNYSGNNPVSQAEATVITAAWSKQAGQRQASP